MDSDILSISIIGQHFRCKQEFFYEYLSGRRVLNGTDRPKTKTGDRAAETVMNTIKQKYRINAHIDIGHILYVNTETHDHDYITINASEETWIQAVGEWFSEHQ